jgi:CAAX prenyl protease-like protein
VDRARSAPLLLVVTALGVVIAATMPHSIAFPATASLRVAIVLAAVGLGATLSRRIGLRLRAHGARHPVLRGSLIGLAFGAYMALADGVLFRHHIPPGQIAIVADLPAWQRMAASFPIVLVDELVYRLCMVPLLASLFGFFAREVTPSANAFRLAIGVTATLYLVLHLEMVTGGGALTLPLVVREIVVHVSAGSLWGYLFWRNGLPTAIVAHMSAHVTLQLGLGLMLP